MPSHSSICSVVAGITLFLPYTVAKYICAGSSATKTCHEYKIDLAVESDVFTWGRPQFKSNFDVVDLIIDLTSRENGGNSPFNGSVHKTISSTIAATFCTPVDVIAAKQDTILLATHGLNYDKRYFQPVLMYNPRDVDRKSYWNPSFEPENYNFVDYAIGQGYSVFFYDRIGVGESSR
jgi:hypothetical protein